MRSIIIYFRTSKKIRTDFRNISSWTRKMYQYCSLLQTYVYIVMYCISYTRRGKKPSFKANFHLGISTQKKHWGSLNPAELSFEILQGVQDIQMGLAHMTNAVGDPCHSAGAAGADTKGHAKGHQRGTLSFPGHHHPAISSHGWKSNLEHPAWALWSAEGFSEKRIQTVAVLGAGGSWGTAAIRGRP